MMAIVTMPKTMKDEKSIERESSPSAQLMPATKAARIREQMRFRRVYMASIPRRIG
jgi:hypothetical protein